MNYKIERILKKNKNNFILILVLWVILSIVLVAPIAYAWGVATQNGNIDINAFIQEIFPAMASFTSIGKVFSNGYISIYGNCMIFFTILFIILSAIGLSKSKPESEYTDIEHGSSDWSENGEQYRVLNKNNGIILAKDNFLPIDKRGNINTLIVGRFRFW